MKTTITELLHEKEILISRLNKMIYGSVEIRSNNEKKYKCFVKINVTSIEFCTYFKGGINHSGFILL